ncbi:Ndufb8, NADH dehydrogenase 19kDa subunit [Abortiporus biennis]|nr:Ndufb8, NADH dehydrogenase 19kDa subunit [Abortiporus biennis]
MQSTVLAARHAAGRRVAALRSVAVRSIASSSTPVPLVKEEEDPQLAGYPVLPWVSKQTRPALGWEDWQMRRNFGETLHEKEEILSMWGPDAPNIPPPIALRWFSIAVLSFVTFGVATKYLLVPDRPAVAREYPFSGLVTELGGLEENKARVEEVDVDAE